ncbi:vesicle transport through interaction with t-SNAREs homolog 1B [Protopterus annectens]|uniref:vesicle transport through interaction with t-SNAREs homolog 1B n=1 Tax=Protopterus annectens TaxID=7888 RepID=UPI001CFC20E4|nr:vesicle transport through interaction with t-SNAREs homolog 1B [Protopterus annectens]
MSSEEFEKLHEQYRAVYEELSHASGQAGRCFGEERKRLIRNFNEQFEEANEMLEGMEEELRQAPHSFRNQMVTKIRGYRRDLGKLQRDIKSTDLGLGPRNQAEYKHTPYNEKDEEQAQLKSQRGLLLQGTESLNRASQSIERSQKVAIETDHIGAEIIGDLEQQRDQLVRTKDRLVHTGEDLSRSRKILRSMSRKIVTNKLLLSFIIIVELGILGGVVYLKFFRK